MIEILLITALIAFIIKVFIKQVKIRNGLSSIPGPPTTFGLGNILQIETSSADLIPKFGELLNKYGDVIKIWIGPFKVIVFVKDVDVIKDVLTSINNINKTSIYALLKPFLGQGLLTSEASTWKIHRKFIEPAFNYNFFNNFVTIFNKKMVILMGFIDKHGSQTPINLDKLIHLYSLDVICEASMGLNMDCQNHDLEYSKALENILHLVTLRAFSVFKRIDIIYKFTSDFSQFNESLYKMKTTIKKILKDCRKVKEQTEILPEEKKIKKSFIDILLGDYMQSVLTDADIEDHINTFLFAGHDTVSSLIYFSLYEIGKNPKIQNRIFEEAESIVGSAEANITVNHLQEMQYLDLVFKEALRKYPPVPMIERYIEEDRQIGKYFFPKGSELNIQIYNLHHDPRYFPDPEEFNPDRFLKDITPFSYIPFSMGIRNCIGKRYANLLYKSAISKLVLNYSLSIPEGFEPQVGIKGTIVTLNGLPIYFKKR